ncbi:MAG: GAF domain-containing protein [Anaerolineae bacterium]
MIERLRAYFEFPQYDSVAERSRARYIALTQVIILVIVMVYAVTIPEWETTPGSGQRVVALQAALTNPVPLGLLLILWALTPITLVLLWSKRLLLAGTTTLLSVLIETTGVVLLQPDVSYDHLLYAMGAVTVVLLAYLLTNQVGGVVVTVINVMALIADPGSAPFEQVLGGIFALIGTAIVSVLYLRLFDVVRVEGLRVASGERSRLAQGIRGLARLSGEQRALESALDASLSLIEKTYPQFRALGVYLSDEAQLYLQLAQSTGVVRTSEQGRYTVGDVSPVGQAAFSGITQTRTQTRSGLAEAASFLPGMRQQIAVPMHFGDQIIGVLDLQSSESAALEAEDIQALEALADALALVVNSARQLQDARQRVEDNARLAEQARNALSEVQRLNKRLIGRAWAEYLKENNALSSMEYDSVSGTLTSVHIESPHLDEAMRRGQPQVAEGVLAFPLRARGQVIGAVELELPPDTDIDDAQIELLTELSERFGLAIENVRLLEQSQRSAQRESLINVISTRIQTTTNVEAMLAETARSLSELLLASHVSIRLGKPDQLPPTRAIEEIA